ncbi:MAG: hypothetical protein KAI81_09225 [Candidatus Marinimicrobia bacterium]|nr:hypothetical protein [Candidatus Neomarinimicrobiota bacterium]
MLGISLHDDYLSFAATTDDADSRVIDQTGIIEFPFGFTKKNLLSDSCSQDLIMLFKELKNTLEFPQNTSRLSLPAHLLTIKMSSGDAAEDEAELKEYQRWTTSVHLGQESYGLLKKQQIISEDKEGKSTVGVFFYPKIIEHILEAAEFVRLGIESIDINPFAAYETVKKNYDISNYERHSILYFDKPDTITLNIYNRERLIKYTTFKISSSGPVFYNALDAELLSIAKLLSEDEWDNNLFDKLGPSFVYGSRNSVESIYDKIDKAYFMEFVNPFVNYKIFKHTRIIDNDIEALSDNLFVEVAGTLFRGMTEND